MRDRALSRLIYDDVDPSALLQRMADQAPSLVPGAEGAAVLMRSGEMLQAVAASGIIADHVQDSVSLDESLSGLSIRRRRPVLTDDALADHRVAAALRRRGVARAALSAPLFRGSDPIGALLLTSSVPGAFGPDALAAVQHVSGFVATALGCRVETAASARTVLEALGELAGAAERPPAVDPVRVGEFMADVMQPGAVSRLRTRTSIATVIAEERMRAVVQPIVHLESGAVRGAEALSRFDDAPGRSPEVWFRQADRVGLGIELQAAAVARGLDLLDQLPADVIVAINVSYDMLVSTRLVELLEDRPAERVLIELTEHLALDDYTRAREAIAALRRRGARLAIDDIGAGFSSLRHVVELAPDTIKLDRMFTDGIENDRACRAMAESLVAFAHKLGIYLVAEGLETEHQLCLVRELGIAYGQGYCIARPADVDAMPHGFSELARRTAPRTSPRRRRFAPRRLDHLGERRIGDLDDQRADWLPAG